MPTHISFFWYKINQKIVIVFHFAIKIIVQNVQNYETQRISTQIGDAVGETRQTNRKFSTCALIEGHPVPSQFSALPLSLPQSLPLPFLLPFPPQMQPLCNPTVERPLLSYWPSFVGKLPLTDVCIVRAHHFTFRLGAGCEYTRANTRMTPTIYHGFVPLRELSRVYPS